jgi:CDP-6-deoxy-D-xylo-4-hexulose-3-dehydrase
MNLNEKLKGRARGKLYMDELRRKALMAVSDYIKEKLRQREFVAGVDRVQYSGPYYDEKEVVAMVDSILNGWFALGEIGRRFEERLAKYVGTTNAVLVNSGSSANLLAVGALIEMGYIKAGDKVITPGLTFPTTLNPLLLYGLKPILVDVDLKTFNINMEELERALSEDPKLIMCPHLLGLTCDVGRVLSLCEKENIILIEDCCDALGTTYNSKKVGSFGLMGTFSFYVAHQITLGEGGAITTNDEKIAYTLRSMREWGRVPSYGTQVEININRGGLPIDYSAKYTFITKGFNLKPLEFQAAFGLEQLEKLPDMILRRKKNFESLHSLFKRYSEYFYLPEPVSGCEPAWYCYPLVVKPDAPFTRKDFVDYLECNKIETRPIFTGNVTKQPAYLNDNLKVLGDLRNCDTITRGGFFLGVYPGIDEKQMNYMLTIIQDFLSNY